MKVLVLGADGYLGYPTMEYLRSKGHVVIGVDDLSKRRQMAEYGIHPLHRISSKREMDIVDVALDFSRYLSQIGKVDAIIHYAEQCSAPYSMMGKRERRETIENNLGTTWEVIEAVRDFSPDTHIIKLGTMGEYGYDHEMPIEEGWLDYQGERIPFPKKPGSIYHLSKVFDSDSLMMACRLWDLRVTDLNQGIVYGLWGEGENATRFCYDDIWGTCLNRFVVQAVAGHPLTVYGEGGQTRGWLNILDTLRCVELAMLNPPDHGEFRVFNQFTETFSVMDIAKKVSDVTGVEIKEIPNPRIEREHHNYEAKHTKLEQLGLVPTLLTSDVIAEMVDYVARYKENIRVNQIMPRVRWG